MHEESGPHSRPGDLHDRNRTMVQTRRLRRYDRRRMGHLQSRRRRRPAGGIADQDRQRLCLGMAGDGRHSGGFAPAIDRRRQLPRSGLADARVAVALVIGHFRQGLHEQDDRLQRRAHVRRSGSLHRRNALRVLSGPDRAGLYDAHAGRLSHHCRAQRIVETGLALGARAGGERIQRGAISAPRARRRVVFCRGAICVMIGRP